MTRQQIFTYAKTKYGTEPDYPWSDTNAVLRHRDNRKWYGLVMEVGREKLGLPGGGLVDVLNVTRFWGVSSGPRKDFIRPTT